MSTVKRKVQRAPGPPELDFDLTQEIDPAFADLLGASTEPTLTQSDFDDFDIGMAPPPRRRA